MKRTIALIGAVVVLTAGLAGCLDGTTTPTPTDTPTDTPAPEPKIDLNVQWQLVDENVLGYDDYAVAGTIENVGNVTADVEYTVALYNGDTRIGEYTDTIENLQPGESAAVSVEYDGDPDDVDEWSLFTNVTAA